MTTNPKRNLGVSVLALCCLFSKPASAQSPITITLEPKRPGPAVPVDFFGLSYEIATLLPDATGKHSFNPTNKPLVEVFKTLGIKNLRVGGNTADRATVKIPTQADADSLFAFARAVDAKVIYTFRLDGGDPKAAAEMAKYLMDHYRSSIASFTIGNEPNKPFTNFATYRAEIQKYLTAITARGAAPNAKFCGPSTTQANPEWAADFAAAFSHDRRINFVTQHAYPARSGRTATNSPAARDRLLSPELLKSYETFYARFMPTVVSNRLTCRLEEVNSFSNGGAAGASDTFASALWALDYLYWWAFRGGVAGFNFHMGRVYGAFVNSADGYSVRPLGYGLKAFDLGSHGRLVSVRSVTNADNVNLTAYGVLARDALFVTLINKEHDAGARDAVVTLKPGTAYARGQSMFLTAPNGDVAARSGVTLGGSTIQDDGSWNGTWTALAPPSKSGEFSMKVPAATAAVLKLSIK